MKTVKVTLVAKVPDDFDAEDFCSRMEEKYIDDIYISYVSRVEDGQSNEVEEYDDEDAWAEDSTIGLADEDEE